MFYGSRSPSSYGEGRYSSYSKGYSYNYSTDLPSSSVPPRNPSIQRVLNSDYGRSRSPIVDYTSSTSRYYDTSLRSLPSSLSGDTSTTIRQRDILDDSRSSPVSLIKSDDIGYSSKSRSYFDYSSTGRFTSYTPKSIKKPQRIDYSDYLRPVLTARPALKTGYVPRSRAERDEDDSEPLVRERKLIKFKESSSDILNKIRRKISWDLPEEISSSLIDEMKEMSSDKTDGKYMLDVTRSRDGSSHRLSSKQISCTSGSSPLSGSPRHSISRRSSGDHSLDSLPAIPLIRKNSPRTNCLISSRENAYDTLDFKADDLATGAHPKAPVPPPRKKSVGSIPNIKKARKSSIETLLSEEKTSNFSKIANEIRRSRETVLQSKSSADEFESETRRPSQPDDTTLLTTANVTEDVDARKQSNASELSAINEVSETNDRGRRRRRRELISESNTSDEKVSEARTRCRSRFRPQISDEMHNSTSADTNQLSEKPFNDETPHPINQMHRKSVKYKPDNLTCRSMSKGSDVTSESSVPNASVQKDSTPSLPVDTKGKTLIQEKSNSLEKKNKYFNAVTCKDKVPVTPKQKLSSQTETVKAKDNSVSEKEDPKSKFYRKQLSSEIISRDKENEVFEKADKIMKTEAATVESSDTGKKIGRIEDKNLDTKNSISNSSSRLEGNEGVKESLNKKSVIETKKLEVKNLSKDIISKTETQQIKGKYLLDKKLSTAETKNFVSDKTKIDTKEADAKGLHKTLNTETEKSNKSFGYSSKIETEEKEVKTLLGTKSTETKTKPSDKNFSDISNTETKEKDTKKVLDKRLTETKTLDVKASVTGPAKTETKIKEEKTSEDKKCIEFESKNLGIKNSSGVASKLESKPFSKDTLSSELESKKSDVKNSFNSISKVETKEKDIKPLLGRKSELETKKSHVKDSSSGISKTEFIDAKTSIDKKSTELDSRKSDVKNSFNAISKVETKEKDVKPLLDRKSELETKNSNVKDSSSGISKTEFIDAKTSIDKKSTELNSRKSDVKNSFNAISKVETKEKDVKSLLDRKSELETKLDNVKDSSSGISKTEFIDAKTSIAKKSTEIDSRKSDVKNSFNDTSKGEAKEKDVKPLLDRKSEMETKKSHVKDSYSGISKTEIIDAKTSIDKKSTELDSKRPYVKNSCDISKTEEAKTLLDSKSTESEVKNIDVTKISSNVSKMDIVRKDTKALLEKKANELESKNLVVKIGSDNSKQESERKDANNLLHTKLIGSKLSEEMSSENSSSKTENKDDIKSSDKKFNVAAKKLDIKNSACDISAKVEAKENEIFGDTAGKVERKKFDVGPVLDDKAKKTETKDASKDLVVGEKSDNLTTKSQNENTRPLGKTQDKFSRNKEAEEIVVVCKLPHLRKLEPVYAKKSIPVEQKVIVSIKNSALKTVDVAESSDDLVKNVAPKVQVIIPDAQSILDSKSEKCDKVSKTPEINVTHTIVLKPKVQSESSYSNIQKVEKQDGRHLKSIPDVIKSTIRSDAKTGDDVSDIVKSTLTKDDDQLRPKKSLPNFKDNLLEKDNIDSLTGLKTSASDGKLASNIHLTAQGKDKADYQMKRKDKDNFSSDTKETMITKDRERTDIKKSSSAVFSAISKEVTHDKSSVKPDLIQMTTEAAKTKSEKILPIVSEDSTAVANLTDERKVSKTPQEKSCKHEGDKCLTNDIKILQPTSKFNEESKKKSDLSISKEKITDSTSSDSSEVKSKDIAQKCENNKQKSLVETKVESKSPEVKISDIPKVKTEYEKIQFDGKSQSPSGVEMTKMDTAPCKGILKTESSDSLNYKQPAADTNASENKEKSTGQKFGINKTVLSDNKTDTKKDAENLKKNKVNLNLNENDLKKTKGVTPAYKKSMTLPNVTVLLEESTSSQKENECSLPNIQRNKKIDSASLSSDNVPAILQVGKPLVPNKDAGKQNLKAMPDSILNSRLKTQSFEKSEEKSSDSNNYETREKQEKPLQLPHINTSEGKDVHKQDFTTLKDSKVIESNSSQTDNISISDKVGKVKVENKEIPVQRKSLKKEEKTESDNKLSSDMKNGAKNKSTGDTFMFDESKDQSNIKLKTETNAFIKDDSTQNSKDISTSVRKSDVAVDNIMPKISDNKRNDESGKDKQKQTEIVKLPSVYDTKSTDVTKICQQETKDSKENRNTESDKSRITLVGSSKNKTPLLQSEAEKVPVENEQSKISQIISKNEQKEKALSPETEKPKVQIISVEDSKNEAKIVSKDDRSELKTNYSEPQKQSLDAIKVTNESRPSKPKKKEIKLPPVPRGRRLGLFLRTKEEEEESITFYDSSSDEESESESETETESESSDEDEDATPVVKKTSNLPNGKSPDRDEKNRTRSETSNASIYSNLSNSTTCTTFSTSSLDDEYGSPVRTTEKLKFRKYEIDDFMFLKLLGKGSFGKVLLAELKDKEMYFAIKCLKKDVVLEDDDVESTMIERRVLALGTQHPYMCKLYCTFQTKSYLFFVMEYLNGGDLMFHIQESRRFEEKRAMFYGAEIVSALKFLHKRGIVYRDIKLDNVMLDEQGHVRLVDFGMCQYRIYREECMPSNFCGTPTYIAPEIILGQKYNQSVDWWSFGVLLYEMLTGRSPFHGTDEDELFWSICNEEPHYPRFLSKEAIHILGLLLTKAPSKRIGMSSSPAGDIKDHAFFSTINWDKLESKQVPPPFKPSVSSPSDTRNFDSSFTMDSATLSPVESEVLESMDQVQFHGFSYTNPHITG